MSCSDNRLDLVPLVSSPSWKLDRDNLWRLPRAHCEEVVRSVYLDEQVRFSGNASCDVFHISVGCFWLSFFITLANPTISIRVNQSSPVVRMASCGHGDLLRGVMLQSSLGLQRLARRRRRRTDSSRTSLYTVCGWMHLHLLLMVVCCV